MHPTYWTSTSRKLLCESVYVAVNSPNDDAGATGPSLAVSVDGHMYEWDPAILVHHCSCVS